LSENFTLVAGHLIRFVAFDWQDVGGIFFTKGKASLCVDAQNNIE
jgi:hypothetical protein